MKRAAWCLLLSSGCALGEGHGFLTVAKAELQAALEPGAARLLPDGSILTDLGYRVFVGSATIGIDRIVIETLSGAGSGGAFDPSSPPPGYTLCHGGHCHHEDGRLVPYSEVQAELSGGTASFQPVLTLNLQRDVDLRADAAVGIDQIEPSVELPQAELSRVRISTTRAAISGFVEGGELGDRQVPLKISVALDGSATGGMDRVVDRSGPDRVRLRIIWSFGGTLFDGINFADGTLPDEESFATRLLSVRPEVEIEEEKEP